MTGLSATGLAGIETRMEESFGLVLEAMEKQQAIMRAMGDALRIILERLTPGESEGPTTGELPARPVEGVGNVDPRTRPIPARLEATRQEPPATIVMLPDEEHGTAAAKGGQA